MGPLETSSSPTKVTAPAQTRIHQSYVMVNFPKCTIPKEMKTLPDMPIPMVEVHCTKRCCGMEKFPLCMSIALTGHKSQGVTIAEGDPFEKRLSTISRPMERVMSLAWR